MAREKGSKGFIELYDATNKQVVAKAMLSEIRFIPRTGERVFISVKGPGDWKSYTVVNVEYFLGFEASTEKPARSLSKGLGRVTLYVEPSR